MKIRWGSLLHLHIPVQNKTTFALSLVWLSNPLPKRIGGDDGYFCLARDLGPVLLCGLLGRSVPDIDSDPRPAPGKVAWGRGTRKNTLNTHQPFSTPHQALMVCMNVSQLLILSSRGL